MNYSRVAAEACSNRVCRSRKKCLSRVVRSRVAVKGRRLKLNYSIVVAEACKNRSRKKCLSRGV